MDKAGNLKGTGLKKGRINFCFCLCSDSSWLPLVLTALGIWWKAEIRDAGLWGSGLKLRRASKEPLPAPIPADFPRKQIKNQTNTLKHFQTEWVSVFWFQCFGFLYSLTHLWCRTKRIHVDSPCCQTSRIWKWLILNPKYHAIMKYSNHKSQCKCHISDENINTSLYSCIKIRVELQNNIQELLTSAKPCSSWDPKPWTEYQQILTFWQ